MSNRMALHGLQRERNLEAKVSLESSCPYVCIGHRKLDGIRSVPVYTL